MLRTVKFFGIFMNVINDIKNLLVEVISTIVYVIILNKAGNTLRETTS